MFSASDQACSFNARDADRLVFVARAAAGAHGPQHFTGGVFHQHSAGLRQELALCSGRQRDKEVGVVLFQLKEKQIQWTPL